MLVKYARIHTEKKNIFSHSCFSRSSKNIRAFLLAGIIIFLSLFKKSSFPTVLKRHNVVCEEFMKGSAIIIGFLTYDYLHGLELISGIKIKSTDDDDDVKKFDKCNLRIKKL